MNYVRKTTYHVSHYNSIVLCNFWPTTLEKDNTSDSSILIKTPPQLNQGSPKAFISYPLPNTLSHLLSNTSESHLIIVVPHAFYHPDLLSNQTYN